MKNVKFKIVEDISYYTIILKSKKLKIYFIYLKGKYCYDLNLKEITLNHKLLKFKQAYINESRDIITIVLNDKSYHELKKHLHNLDIIYISFLNKVLSINDKNILISNKLKKIL